MSDFELSLQALIATRAREMPDGVALRHTEGSSLNWQSFLEGSLAMADALQMAGVRESETVASMFPNSIDAAIAWAGCGWLGAIEAPINTSFRLDWLAHAFNLNGARMLLAHREFLPAVWEIERRLEHLEMIVVFGGMPDTLPQTGLRIMTAEEFLSQASPRERPVPGLWDTAALIMTSGTTGPSKAVVIPWGQLAAGSNIDWGVPVESEVIYSPFPPYHISGKGPVYMAARHPGSRAILAPRMSASEYWPHINDYGCTQAVMLGPMAEFLMSQPPRDDDAANPLKRVLMAPVIKDIEAFVKRFDVNVFTCYNMTETSMPLVSGREALFGEGITSCGKARPGVEARLVDENDLEVPPNTPGELILRTEPWEMNQGYWRMPEESFKAWRNGWFHTGDTFIRDEEGRFYFADRKKDYIRRRGNNISSFEVEACVNQHPEVIESCAVAVASEINEDEVKIAVVLTPDSSLEPHALLEFLRTRMPDFALPRYIEFLPELPKTQATLRIQKARIRDAGVTADTWDSADAG
ncbi:AMP-binding protein [Pseudohaliea sp.]|uniref:AMP-binding protein n=1 Tax=Pseudohaliea sp. TaxID=2740289 RepID=UPI0032EE4710